MIPQKVHSVLMCLQSLAWCPFFTHLGHVPFGNGNFESCCTWRLGLKSTFSGLIRRD